VPTSVLSDHGCIIPFSYQPLVALSVVCRAMGNEASSENDRRARHRMVSYKQFVRDLKHLNTLCEGSFIDVTSGCHLSFEAVTNLTHHELLPVVWRQAGRILVIAHTVQSAAVREVDGSAAMSGSDVDDGMERKDNAALVPAKALSVHQFYHLFGYVVHNAPILHHAKARLRKLQQQQDELTAASASASMADSDDSRVCSICLSADVEIALPCLHAFCAACIEDWHTHDHSCPMCRTKADVNSEAGDSWMMEGGSETELREL